MDKIFKITETDYSSIKKGINSLLKEYTFLRSMSIGKSCLGREIYALKLGNAENYSLITAGINGSEYITSILSLIWLENLCEAIKTDGVFCGLKTKKALYGRGVIIVPSVNPDGCEIALKGALAGLNMSEEIKKLCHGNYKGFNANARGVNINNNFGAGWEELKQAEIKKGISAPHHSEFCGYTQKSEPETKAICRLCETGRIRHILDLHLGGRTIYRSYKSKSPKKSRQMAEILATAGGYSIDSTGELLQDSGLKNWFISEFDRPAFTLRIGKERENLSEQDVEKLVKEISEMLMLATVM